jgi:hypothetical protein
MEQAGVKHGREYEIFGREKEEGLRLQAFFFPLHRCGWA